MHSIPPWLREIESLQSPLPAAILLELPQRELGGTLPSWVKLKEIRAWADAKEIALHLDGARLWECGLAFDRPYSGIAALFDSVYVSFYKGLDGITGAALAGNTDFIDEARIWQRRHGGNLHSLFPYVISAREGLKRNLPRMAAYCQKARSLAGELSQIPGIRIVPENPRTNMMWIHLAGDRSRLENASLEIADEKKVSLFRKLRPSPIDAHPYFELSVGSATLEIPNWELRNLFTEVLGRASAG